MRFDEKHRRRDLVSNPKTAKYRDLVTWADQFIFIFPIWWSGMPAMLKGFMDCVFVAGFAYYNTKTGLKGHLKGKAWLLLPTIRHLLLHYFLKTMVRSLKIRF